ncbi:hypothetical protein HAX54_053208 [Datura stramonium]|uniref:F-box associated beta-propeller type 1 domain-containing protein n=1 Tax=Datura stramonium TaxID=4076 RepID=A0ABS8WPC9_DATST|nr:hypothetical protein [Datura stramonium]
MEDEGCDRHPKRSKPTNHCQFPSTSMQESTSTIPILPEELISEILSRLPVKPLLKFRIIGSVNGLICLSTENDHLFMWNPSIRKYTKLPDPKPRLRKVYWRQYGFGYDEFHDDYKIVGIFFFDEYGTTNKDEIKIYSLKSDSWRSVDPCPIEDLSIDSGEIVIVFGSTSVIYNLKNGSLRLSKVISVVGCHEVMKADIRTTNPPPTDITDQNDEALLSPFSMFTPMCTDALFSMFIEQNLAMFTNCASYLIHTFEVEVTFLFDIEMVLLALSYDKEMDHGVQTTW